MAAATKHEAGEIAAIRRADGESRTLAASLPRLVLEARRIAANPPHVVRMTKRLLREASSAGLATVLETSAAMQALAHATADHREAVDALLGRRRPTFHGR